MGKPHGPPMLAVREINHRFRNRLGMEHQLHDISFAVREGEFFCLLGPSGCGKSVLLSLVTGLQRPEYGQILLDGDVVTGPGPDRVLMLPEGPLYSWLTVRANVGFGLWLKGCGPQESHERVTAALRRLRLEPMANRYPHRLSPGVRQRVAVARAVAMAPRLLVMDEPFAPLDAQTRNVLDEDLQAVWAATGQTVLLATHNVGEAVRLADRIAVLSFRTGRIKRVVAIPYPRPRRADDPHLIEIRTFLLRELKEEVQAAVEEELGRG